MNNHSTLYILFLFSCLIRECKTVTKFQISGDLILGGLFPIHRKSNVTENECGLFHLQPGYQYMIAMLFAIQQINKRSDLLPNITLGTKIYDTCRSTTIGADRARDFIKDALFFDKAPLVGVVGPFISDVSIATAPLLRVFGIPQISYGSSSSSLSNKELYSNFFRTVPPDSFQAEAIADILEYFGWRYIVTISSKGNYGENGIKELSKSIKKNRICIAVSKYLPYLPKPSDYKRIILEVLKDTYNKVNVIVLFTTQTDSSGLLKAALEVQANRFTWVGSSGWSNRMDVINGKEKIANGSITVNHLGGKVKEFHTFYNNLTSHANIPWSSEFFKHVLNCNHGSGNHPLVNNCSRRSINDTLTNMEMSPERVVINAVYAFANALHDMQLVTCRGTKGLCDEMKTKLKSVELVEYLRNTTFQDSAYGIDMRFNDQQEMDGNYSIMNFQQKSDGSWDYVNVGEWGVVVENLGKVKKSFKVDVDSVSWGNSQTRPPVSVCSRRCLFPYISKPHALHSLCCWNCILCKENEIIVNDSCQSCQLGYHPTANLSKCSKIPEVYPSFKDPPAIACTVITILSMAAAVMVALFFLKYRDHAVVKASGRELSAIILVGILLCYIAVFPLLMRPSSISCTLHRYLGSLCYTFCYAPLLMKTNRIYRIFTQGKKAVSRPSMVSPTSQVLITAGLIAVQIFITTVWTLAARPGIALHFHSIQSTITECKTENVSLACNLSYNIVLMILCTIFAFKTRQFPRNFNEAKYIGILMYLTCSVWIIFLPSLFNTDNTYIKVYIQITSHWIIGTIILFGLFVPKIYFVLFSNEHSLTTSEANNSRHSEAFVCMNKLQNASSVANPRGGSEANCLHVHRLHSGHVFGEDGELKNGIVTPSGSVTPCGSVTPSREPQIAT